MRSRIIRVACCVGLIILLASPAGAQTESAAGQTPLFVSTMKPQYLPPADLLSLLGARGEGNQRRLDWRAAEGIRSVDVRVNDVSNLLIISGDSTDVVYVQNLIRQSDLPPRQIEIEVKIVEISTNKARNIGLDWENLFRATRVNASALYQDNRRITRYDNGYDENDYHNYQSDAVASATTNVSLYDLLKILDSSGVGTSRTAPKVLTLNNRRATILDGQRVTYITRYDAYHNLYQTDSMDAGLTLSVLPSLGESGYITLDINAEMTNLSGNISGSPVKDGQMINNTVVVKDGQSILLGGLSRKVESKYKKRFPLLGYVLPFLFSRESTRSDQIESIMILTPHVVDFAGALDDHTKSLLDGGK